MKPKTCVQKLFLFVDKTMESFPQVQDFVRSNNPKAFRGLQIENVLGSQGLKHLYDNGNMPEELSILKWNTDSVEESLAVKLEHTQILLKFCDMISSPYQIKYYSTY